MYFVELTRLTSSGRKGEKTPAIAERSLDFIGYGDFS
jgi:hypothetical protein